MAASASRSNGTKGNPAAQYIRFTEDQNDRLHRVRAHRGQTIQTFCHAAVMKAVVEAEKEMEEEESRRGRKKKGATAASKAKGLGIRERLAEMDNAAPASPPPAPVETAPSVHVNVTTHAAPQPGSDIPSLAKFVVGAPRGSIERRNRLAEACRILTETVSSRDEAVKLAERLDDEIKGIDSKPQSVLDRIRSMTRKKT